MPSRKHTCMHVCKYACMQQLHVGEQLHEGLHVFTDIWYAWMRKFDTYMCVPVTIAKRQLQQLFALRPLGLGRPAVAEHRGHAGSAIAWQGRQGRQCARNQ